MRERRLRLYPADAVRFQIQSAEEWRREAQGLDRRAHVVLKAGEGELRAAHAASRGVAGLEQRDLTARLSEHDGHQVYVIQSVPREEAAVVWGREVLTIRDDHVVLEHAFYDQDGELVKSLHSLEIAEMGGRTIATRQRMAKTDEPDEWTEISVNEVEYELELKDSVFTLSNLRNPRD